MDTKLVCNVM